MKKLLNLKIVTLFLICCFLVTGCSNKGKESISIEIWHYYNGTQKIAFDEMVMEFNETIGLEKGIIVEAFSQGNINDLEVNIHESINKMVGSQEPPNMFAAYPDTAYKVDKLGFLVSLDTYMTDKELNEYIDSYIEEGRFGEDNKPKIFPIAKATEIMMVNKTDWDKFSNEVGVTTKDLSTWEGVARVAEVYYNWTDSLTAQLNDGKAFFGRDAMANYILVGSKQLGKEIFKIKDGRIILDLDEEIMLRMWENFYIPYIKGYYASYGRFRSDDAKVGEIIAMVGSTAGAVYFPENVTIGDNENYEIEAMMLPLPNFENTTPYAIQQGAGMVILKSDRAHELASIEFLKWFTNSSRNIKFSIESGYLPVKKSVNSKEYIEKELAKKSGDKVPEQLVLSLPIAMEQLNSYNIYIGKLFENGTLAREVLTNSLLSKAKEDREKVIELMDKGKSHRRAVAEVATEENFKQWFLNFKAELENITK